MRSEWLIFSSYDLNDKTDGASLHLADFRDHIPHEYNASIEAMKRRPTISSSFFAKLTNKNSLVFSIFMTAYFFLFRRSEISQKTGAFLFGFHSLVFCVLNKRCIYVPMDCWSARENRIAYAPSTKGASQFIRRAYAVIVAFIERSLVHRSELIFVVSGDEAEKYALLYPELANRIFVIPPKGFEQKMPVRKTLLDLHSIKLLIWMDCRVGYGQESVREALSFLKDAQTAKGPQIEVHILSRMGDEQIANAIDGTFINHKYVDDLVTFLDAFDIILLPDQTGSGIKNRVIQTAIIGKNLICRPEALEGFGFEKPEDYAVVYRNFSEFSRGINVALQFQNWDKINRAFQFCAKFSSNDEVYQKLWDRISIN